MTRKSSECEFYSVATVSAGEAPSLEISYDDHNYYVPPSHTVVTQTDDLNTPSTEAKTPLGDFVDMETVLYNADALLVSMTKASTTTTELADGMIPVESRKIVDISISENSLDGDDHIKTNCTTTKDLLTSQDYGYVARSEDTEWSTSDNSCDWNTPICISALDGNEESIPIVVQNSTHFKQIETQKVLSPFPDESFIYHVSDSEIKFETPQQVPVSNNNLTSVTDEDVVFDYDFASVALNALTTGDLSPLVKEELKCAILSKRLANGQGEPEIEYKDEDTDELTPEIAEKRKERRERNKVAARKCRSKRKERSEILQEEIDNMEDKNSGLQCDIKKLKEEHEKLMMLFKMHLNTPFCTKKRKH